MENKQDYLEPYAYKRDGLYYCEDCYKTKFFPNATDIAQLIEDSDDNINENTVQYEQYPGELIPIEGIECCCCGVELYPSTEEEDY